MSSLKVLLLGGTLCGLVACTQNQTEKITEVDLVDRVGLFKSKVWKTERAKALRQIQLGVTKWSTPLGQAEGNQRAAWQLSVMIEGALESEPRPEADGKIPKDQVWRQLELRLRLHRLAEVVSNSVNAEYELATIFKGNRPILSAPESFVLVALEHGLGLLEFKVRLEEAPDSSLAGLMAGAKTGELVHILSEVRKRKLRELVPTLIVMLEKENVEAEAELEIIGALIAIKDPRAVVPLINSSQRRHEVYLTQIIFGVAEIGGKQAEAYLFTLKAGHPKASIRKHAADALSELNRRKGKVNE